jgi:hypothetical protein
MYILCLCDWPAELFQRSLQPRNPRLEILNLVFLVFTRAIHVWQGRDCASCLLYLETDVVCGSRDMLDLERPFSSKLGGCWRRSWRLDRRLEDALEEFVEVGKNVKR